MRSLTLILVGLVCTFGYGDDPECPTRLTPHTTQRVTVLGITVTEASGVSDLGCEWGYVYSDNRHDVGYRLDFEGEITMFNPTANGLYMRFHFNVPLYYTPFEPTFLENACYERDDQTIVVYHEILVPAGETVVYEWTATADFGEVFEGADFNGDYYVDAADLGLLYAAWGTSDPTYDLNDDGVVNGIDLGILLENWTDTNG